MEELKLGLYRHFKGNDYQVLGLARNSETLDYMVIYKALYGDFETWVRPIDMFSEKVMFEGEEILRFKFIHE